MDYQLNTRLNGNIAMTSRFHENKRLQRDKTLYKFLWVQNGSLAVEVDHIPMKIGKGRNHYAYPVAPFGGERGGRRVPDFGFQQ